VRDAIAKIQSLSKSTSYNHLHVDMTHGPLQLRVVNHKLRKRVNITLSVELC
jgi:hypothetical protein